MSSRSSEQRSTTAAWILGPQPNTTINTLQPTNYKLSVKDLKALEVAGSGSV